MVFLPPPQTLGKAIMQPINSAVAAEWIADPVKISFSLVLKPKS
jgi:hypothetical protein